MGCFPTYTRLETAGTQSGRLKITAGAVGGRLGCPCMSGKRDLVLAVFLSISCSPE